MSGQYSILHTGKHMYTYKELLFILRSQIADYLSKDDGCWALFFNKNNYPLKKFLADIELIDKSNFADKIKLRTLVEILVENYLNYGNSLAFVKTVCDRFFGIENTEHLIYQKKLNDYYTCITSQTYMNMYAIDLTPSLQINPPTDPIVKNYILFKNRTKNQCAKVNN